MSVFPVNEGVREVLQVPAPNSILKSTNLSCAKYSSAATYAIRFQTVCEIHAIGVQRRFVMDSATCTLKRHHRQPWVWEFELRIHYKPVLRSGSMCYLDAWLIMSFDAVSIGASTALRASGAPSKRLLACKPCKLVHHITQLSCLLGYQQLAIGGLSGS